MYKEKIEFGDGTPFVIKIQSINKYSIHWHENVTEIILPIKGDIEVVTSFERNVVHEGDFWFVNNKYVHSINSSNNAVIAIFHINLDYFKSQFEYIKYMYFRSNIYSENYNNDLSSDIKTGYKKRFRNLLIDMLSDTINYNKSPVELGEKYEYQLIYSMVYGFNWLQFQRKSNKFISQGQLNRYLRIVKFVDAHYAERITLKDIVDREFITKNYFSHFWKDLSNYNFQEYISYVRVLKSEYLLLNNISITSISEQCGFSDSKYYYWHFKKWYGCTPVELRNRYISYIKMGVDYEDLEPNGLGTILNNYINSYFPTAYDHSIDSGISFFLENCMKAKYLYAKEKETISNFSKSIIINLFDHVNYYLDEMEFSYNWSNIDLLVNLSLELDVPIYFRMTCDGIDRALLHKAIINFIDSCISRYGMKILRDWHFFVNFRDVSLYEEVNKIKKIFDEKLQNPKINYSFEF